MYGIADCLDEADRVPGRGGADLERYDGMLVASRSLTVTGTSNGADSARWISRRGATDATDDMVAPGAPAIAMRI